MGQPCARSLRKHSSPNATSSDGNMNTSTTSPSSAARAAPPTKIAAPIPVWTESGSKPSNQSASSLSSECDFNNIYLFYSRYHWNLLVSEALLILFIIPFELLSTSLRFTWCFFKSLRVRERVHLELVVAFVHLAEEEVFVFGAEHLEVFAGFAVEEF